MLVMNRLCGNPKIFARRDFLFSLTLLPTTVGRNTFAKINNQSAIWIWKDRVLNPEGIGKFSQRYGFDTLFLYVTPNSCRALLNKEPSALQALMEMRGVNRKIFALVGEPDWSWGIKEVPEHVALIIESLCHSNLFDGIQFDIEPHSLADWESDNSRAKLMRGLIQFYRFIRKKYSDIHIDAVVNPSYSDLKIGSRSFLEEIIKYVDTISIMAYRKGIDRAIDWATPSIRSAERNNRGWRMGLSIDNGGPEVSWKNLNYSELNVVTEEMRIKLQQKFHCKKFLGISFHDFDGFKELIEKT
jgi:hypothetical protein